MGTSTRDLSTHEDQLRIMWIAWAACCSLFALVSFCVWLAILLSKKARSSPFNWYLLYVVAPDWLFAALSCAVSSLNAFVGHYYDEEWLCSFQAIYTIWTTACVSWLNAVIAYEIHYMLWSSFRCIRYQPPTHGRATRNSLAVYVWATVLSCWSGFGHPLVYRSEAHVQHELLCLPVNFSGKTMLFFWFLVAPLVTIIPFAFVMWVVFDAWRNKLLPRKGQRRMLSIYFFRIAVLNAVFIFPPSVGLVVAPIREAWIAWALSIWGHSHVFFLALVSLWKPDISLAVRELFTCNRECRDAPSVPIKTTKENGVGTTFRESHTLTMCTKPASSWSILPISQRSVGGRRSEVCASPSKNSPKVIFTCASSSALEPPGLEEQSDSETERQGDHTLSFLEKYEDVPKQSDIHYQFDDELDENDVIAYHIEEEEDETDLPVSPFDDDL